MRVAASNIAELRSTLLAILLEECSERQLNGVVRFFHAIAVTFLKSKLASGRLSSDFVRLNVNDLAYDCIADLFQRDERNSLIQLKSYFGGLSLEALSDEALIAHSRRLAFSKVNQNVFRIYNELDPALGKILRNIKLAVLALKSFDEIERFGEIHLVPACCEPLPELPEISEEVLLRELRLTVRGTAKIPEMMSSLGLYLRTQDSYSRRVPLIMAARTFRSILLEPDAPQHVLPMVETKLILEDAATLIRESCEAVRTEYLPKYVGRKKISEKTYGHYFSIIERRLQAVVLGHDGKDFSLFQEFKKLAPPLTRAQYQMTHKNILEYLNRMVEDRVREGLRAS